MKRGGSARRRARCSSCSPGTSAPPLRAGRPPDGPGRQNGAMDHHFVGIPDLTGFPRVAVVIDVMRAFTVAAWAFSRGVERIVLASTEIEALALKESHLGWVALKDGAPAAGFDAVNSPGLLRSRDFAGRTMVQKTTAGTVGALAVADAPLVLCASFVVAGPTAVPAGRGSRPSDVRRHRRGRPGRRGPGLRRVHQSFHGRRRCRGGPVSRPCEDFPSRGRSCQWAAERKPPGRCRPLPGDRQIPLRDGGSPGRVSDGAPSCCGA